MLKTIFTSLAIAACVATQVSAETITGAARVLDGDTIEVGGQTIDLMYINAPELNQTCVERKSIKHGNPKPVEGTEFDGGAMATDALTKIIAKNTVSCKIYRWKRSKLDKTLFGNGDVHSINPEVLKNTLFGNCSTRQTESLSVEMAKLGMVWTYPTGVAADLIYRKDRKTNKPLKALYRQVLLSIKEAEQAQIGVYSFHPFFPKCLIPSKAMKKGKLQ